MSTALKAIFALMTYVDPLEAAEKLNYSDGLPVLRTKKNSRVQRWEPCTSLWLWSGTYKAKP